MFNWEKVDNLDQLFALRFRILEQQEDDVQTAMTRVGRYRAKLADFRNKNDQHRMRPRNALIKTGDLVLTWNSPLSINMTTAKKLRYRWKGPYKVVSISQTNTYKYTNDRHMQRWDLHRRKEQPT